MVNQNRDRINFKELKKLPHALSLKLNDKRISSLPYAGYLMSHGLYWKFCSPLLRLSKIFIQPTCRTSYNNTTRSVRSSSKLLFTVPTVDSVTYGEHGFSFSAPASWNSLPDSIKNTTTLLPLKSTSKHSCFGIFVLLYWFYEEMYLAFMSPTFILSLL